MHRLIQLFGLLWLLFSSAAPAWPQAAQQLARQAQAEFSKRIVVVESLADPQALALPADAQRELHAAQAGLFQRVNFRGVIAPFRRHWFDQVRCAIYVPGATGQPDAELWSLAHELGHCVARLNDWQPSLWTDPDVAARHRTESWADAFALLVLPENDRERMAGLALRARANLGSDAAYMTERAIQCALAAGGPPRGSLTETGRRVEELLQGNCLTAPAHLQATQSFLSSLR